MQEHRIDVRDTSIASFEEGGYSVMIEDSEYGRKCQIGDRIIVTFMGSEVFRGIITCWEVGSDFRIWATDARELPMDLKDIFDDVCPVDRWNMEAI